MGFFVFEKLKDFFEIVAVEGEDFAVEFEAIGARGDLFEGFFAGDENCFLSFAKVVGDFEGEGRFADSGSAA